MRDNSNPKLLVSKTEASEKIRERINAGKELHEVQISSKQELTNLKHKTEKWIDYNHTLFESLFDESPLNPLTHGHRSVYLTNTSLNYDIDQHKGDIIKWINDLESIYEQLEIYEELPNNTQQAMNRDTMNNENKKIFIGHGGSPEWLKLKDFFQNTLELPYEEFNRIPQAGKTTTDRLKKMLESCCIAFLIMTGEDEYKDGTLHARENVIHEIGLFQAQLGFERAIILREDGCEIFSNIQGITYIPFPKGNIRSAFEGIRDVLKREGIT